MSHADVLSLGRGGGRKDGIPSRASLALTLVVQWLVTALVLFVHAEVLKMFECMSVALPAPMRLALRLSSPTLLLPVSGTITVALFLQWQRSNDQEIVALTHRIVFWAFFLFAVFVFMAVVAPIFRMVVPCAVD